MDTTPLDPLNPPPAHRTQDEIPEILPAPSPLAESLPALDGLECLERIGSGSTGVVYKAYQPSLQRYVALKILRAPEFASAEEAQRFRREADLLAASSHPHIVPVFGCGELEVGPEVRCPYFTMRLMEGGSLAAQAGRPADNPRTAAEIMAAIAGAIHHAHQRGILHRDLKPANILLDADGRPLVADFGMARQTGGATGLTPSGVLVGTPAYMAPEQARGDKALTPAADVYGLGAILYELLTGRPPFQAESPLEVLRQVLAREPVRPRALNRKVDRSLEAVCLKCLQKDPARRYASAAELADDLGRWLRGKPVLAQASRPWHGLVRWTRRRPAVVALVVLLLALVVVGLTVVNRQGREEDWAPYVEGLKAAEQRLGEGNKPGAVEALDSCPRSQRGWEWNCLKCLCKKSSVTWHGYYRESDNSNEWGQVDRFGSSPDLAFVEGLTGVSAVVCADQEVGVQVLDADDQKLKSSWKFPGGFTFLGFCARGHRVVGQVGTLIKVWDALSGEEISTFHISEGVRPCWLRVSASGQYLATAMQARRESEPRLQSIEVWNTATGAKVSRIVCDPPAQRVVLSPDGKRLAVQIGFRPEDPSAYIWKVHDSTTGAEVAQFGSDPGLDRVSAFSPDGRLFASVRAVQFRGMSPWELERHDLEMERRASANNYLGSEIAVWDAETGERLYALPREGAGSFQPFLCFTPDSQRLLTSGSAASASGRVLPRLDANHRSRFEAALEVRVARTGQELVRFVRIGTSARGVGVMSQDGNWLGLSDPILMDNTGTVLNFTPPGLSPLTLVLVAVGVLILVGLWLLVRSLERRATPEQMNPQ